MRLPKFAHTRYVGLLAFTFSYTIVACVAGASRGMS